MARKIRKKQKNTRSYFLFFIILLIILGTLILSFFTSHSQEQRVSRAETTFPRDRYIAANGLIYFNQQPIQLKGVNWYGFETKDHVMHGLWYQNWKELIGRVKSLGFNAVRIPFCPGTLYGTVPQTIEYYHNQDLKGLNSLEILDKFVQELNNQHIFFILDHHVPDCDASKIPDLWYTNSYSEAQWIQDLKFVAARYKDLNYFVGVDLKNEPHGKSSWGTGDSQTDWNTAAENAGAAVLQANSNILIFVEGIGENSLCSSTSPHIIGENLEPQNCYPISSSKIPAHKLVFSPHIYGPYVTNNYPEYFKDPAFPANLPMVWDKHFGFLVDQGYTVIPGEWGGWYGSYNHNTPIDKKDTQWQDALANYFVARHICSSFYWALNPDSPGTGGVLEFNWWQPVRAKVAFLSNYFNSCTPKINILTVPSVPTAKNSFAPTQAVCQEQYGEYCEDWPGAKYKGYIVGRFYGCGEDRYVNTGKRCSYLSPTPVQAKPGICITGLPCNCDGLAGRDGPGKCGTCGGAWCDGNFCHCPPPAR